MNELPTYHGPCPYCGSAISVVIQDGTTVARCSHRGCGARGPIMRSTERAVELFRAGRCVKVGSGASEVELRSPTGPAFTAGDGGESPRTPIDLASEASGGVCGTCRGVDVGMAHWTCPDCKGTGRAGGPDA